MAYTMAGSVSGPADRTKSGPTRARDASSQESQKKPDIFRRIWVFITQVTAEMKRATYPIGEEIQTYFVVVIVFVTAIMVLTGLPNLGFDKLNILTFDRHRTDPPAGIYRRVSSMSRQPREPDIRRQEGCVNEDKNSIEFEDETEQLLNVVEKAAAETPAKEAADTAPEAEKDSAQETVDPLETFRRGIMMTPGDWYVTHTYSGHERKTKANLEQCIASQNMEEKIFRTEVPDEYIDEFKGSVKKRVCHARISGYVVVCIGFDDDSYRVVKDALTVTDFVGGQHNPVPLPTDEAVDLLKFDILEEAGSQAAPTTAVKGEIRVAFEIGEVVSIVEGPFEGMGATISQILFKAQKLKVFIMIFEREAELELASEQVAKREE